METGKARFSLWREWLIEMHARRGVLILASPAPGLKLCSRDLIGSHVLSQPIPPFDAFLITVGSRQVIPLMRLYGIFRHTAPGFKIPADRKHGTCVPMISRETAPA